MAKDRGIADRGPTEVRDQTLPWIDESVQCLGCGHRWVLMRRIGDDYRKALCPFCFTCNSELDGEAPLLLPKRR